MAKNKSKTIFVCQQCGNDTPRWFGRCPACNAWNSLVETVETPTPLGFSSTDSLKGVPQPLSDISPESLKRICVPIDEFNRVLGGGIVPGSLVLIGGDPGIGKSTILLQVSGLFAQEGRPVLYVSAEESVQQVKIRAERLGIVNDHLFLLSENSLNHIISQIEKLKPQLIIIDSIQTVYKEELTSAAGSVAQVRECALSLLNVAKGRGIPTFLVGHVTKEGAIAGPRVLEHIVDTVLYLEGERFQAYRLLRSVKNRFGSTHEVGVFEMSGDGMIEVQNPSQVFLAERASALSGSSIVVTLEGTRPLLVEIQALTTTTTVAMPRRTTNGLEFNRLLLLTAVLTKRVGLSLSNQDVFVNVTGGFKISEPAADLGVAVAIASSYRDKPVQHDVVCLGEIGLSGELRGVNQLDKRLAEAAKLGFKKCVIPRLAANSRLSTNGLELLTAVTVNDALEMALR